MPKKQPSKIDGRPRPLVVIVGSTASGKSDLAVQIARLIKRLRHAAAYGCGAEIISADSRQVYRGMDIGAGKITRREMHGVPHHLLDVTSPRHGDFNVSHFVKLARRKIVEIAGRGHTPIIVGGTGFWIDALLYGLAIPQVPPNPALRSKLERQSLARLHARLARLDPTRAATVDRRNKRRLIRALEIVLATGKPVPRLDWPRTKAPPRHDRGVVGLNVDNYQFKPIFIGIKLAPKELKQRIRARLNRRLKQGMIAETKKLHQSGVSWERLDNFGLEYRYISRYLRGQLTYDQMVAQLNTAIWHYAKRQMTWLKRNKQIKWLSH